MVGRKLKRVLMIPVALVIALTLVATACTPAEVEALRGVLQNVDSANGKITIVTNDGKTVTLNIETDTEAVSGGNTTINVSTLKPGTQVEVEAKGKTARRIKSQERDDDNEGKDRGKDTSAIGWGIVELRVTDPPPAGVKSAVVSFSNIEVHRASINQGDDDDKDEDEDDSDNVTGASGNTTGTSGNTTGGSNSGSSWIPITTNITSFDLMDVIGIEQILGSANLTAGKYTQIRMTVTNVTGVTTDNVSYTAEVPGGNIKIVGNFKVGGGNKTVLTLDFDGEKSLIKTGDGRFIFKPVVKLLVNGKAPVDGEDDDDDKGKPREIGKPDDAGKPSDNRTQGKSGEDKGNKQD